MKKSLLVNSIIISLVGFGLAYVFYMCSGVDMSGFHHKNISLSIGGDGKMSYKSFTRELPVENMTSLNISTVGADVTIRQSKEENAKLSITTTKQGMNNLKIQNVNKTVSISYAPVSGGVKRFDSVTITLPKSIKSVQLQTTSGDVSINSTDLDNVEVSTVSGDVTLNNTYDHLKRIDVRSVSGDVAVNVDKTQELKVNVTSRSGDVSVAKELTRKDKLSDKRSGVVELQSVSGDIELK